MIAGHLVVVDLQRIFAEATSPWAAPAFARVIEPTAALVAAYRGRLTFTRFVAPAVARGAWAEYYAQWPFALRAPDDPWYDVVEQFAADAAGATIDETTFGKWGAQLAARSDGADTLVVSGVSTDCCVLSTALAAADAGRRVLVVADACAGSDELAHTRALEAMALYAPLVQVTTSAQVLSGDQAAVGQDRGA